jgi:putative hemolysin
MIAVNAGAMDVQSVMTKGMTMTKHEQIKLRNGSTIMLFGTGEWAFVGASKSIEYELWLDSIQLPPDYQEAIDKPLTTEEKNQVKIDQIFPPF